MKTTNSQAPATISDLVPYAQVETAERSIAFYAHLGFTLETAIGPEGHISWAALRSEEARLFVQHTHDAIDRTQQGVLFYMYCDDLERLRSQLIAAGIEAGAIEHPPHMPRGEMRLEDPDGYTLLIGEPGEPAGD